MKKLRILYFFIAVSLLVGCGSDDNEVASDGGIVADFSFTSEESRFVFTNLSEGATTYRWDFGDLNFYCEKENPTYTYTKEGGELEVTLTAINESGQEAYITKTIIAPVVLNVQVEIDGNFDEWVEIPVAYDQSGLGIGTLQKIKMWGKGDNLHIYLEGNTSMKMELTDIYINSDGNSTTGFLSWQWPEGSGAEFLIQGAYLSNSWGDFYEHIDPNGGWGWNRIAGTEDITSSGVVSLDERTNAVEIKIPKSKLGSLGTTISLAITELTEGWAEVASFPLPTASSAFVTYEFPSESVSLCE